MTAADQLLILALEQVTGQPYTPTPTRPQTADELAAIDAAESRGEDEQMRAYYFHPSHGDWAAGEAENLRERGAESALDWDERGQR